MTPAALAQLRAFISHEATAGLILVAAAALALLASNIAALKPFYDGFLSLHVSVSVGALGLSKPLLLWINDGLMAVFFFLVGLEIKREAIEGHLSSPDQVILPALAALGGMLAPALVFYLINHDNPDVLRGWAIPSATDIAFALGMLSLAGRRVPLALKIFLLTLATLDDLGAIVVIAVFYASKLSGLALSLAAGALLVLVALNRGRVERAAIYVIVGMALWVFVLKSGIHATLAGVALGLMVPLRRRDGSAFIHALEDGLHPWVKFLILPLFAFANAGVSLGGLRLASLLEPLPLGIAAGLVLGKPLGIMTAAVLAVGLRLARLPEGVGWAQLLAVACLAGIGFTMSLFIGMLAFEDAEHAANVRIGVIAGSLVSTALGLGLLFGTGTLSRSLPKS